MARQSKVIQLPKNETVTEEEKVVLSHYTERFVKADQERNLRWQLLNEYAVQLAAAHSIDLDTHELNVATGEFTKKAPAPKE